MKKKRKKQKKNIKKKKSLISDTKKSAQIVPRGPFIPTSKWWALETGNRLMGCLVSNSEKPEPYQNALSQRLWQNHTYVDQKLELEIPTKRNVPNFNALKARLSY